MLWWIKCSKIEQAYQDAYLIMCIGLAKKFLLVLYQLMENPEELFGQPNISQPPMPKFYILLALTLILWNISLELSERLSQAIFFCKSPDKTEIYSSHVVLFFSSWQFWRPWKDSEQASDLYLNSIRTHILAGTLCTCPPPHWVWTNLGKSLMVLGLPIIG